MAESVSLHIHDIPELLVRIFEELEDDRASLARLARTSKAFVELALDVLWRSWDVRMEPALQNALPDEQLPPSVFTVGENITHHDLLQSLTTYLQPLIDVTKEKWDRFFYYSKRLRIWDAEKQNFYRRIHEVRKGVELFPSLYRLIIPAHLNPSYTLSTRLPHSLRALRITCGTIGKSFVWTYVLAAISQVPLLEELAITGHIDPLVCIHIPSFTKLRRLNLLGADFGPFDAKDRRIGLQGLLGMENLVDVALPKNLKSDEVPWGAGSISNNLRTIDLGGDVYTIIKVVVALSKCAIKDITFHSPVNADPLSLSMWKMCFCNMNTYYTASLRRLVFSCTDTGASTLDFDTIQPLLQLARLEEYVNPYNLRISLKALTMMAKSWPEIRQLTLHLTIIIPGSKRHTEEFQILGLVPFASLCTKLQILDIKFSNKFRLPNTFEFPLLPHPLHEIRLQDPGIDQYVQLAILIDRIFPSLDNVRVGGSGGSRWVSQMTRAFQNIRRESRSMV